MIFFILAAFLVYSVYKDLQKGEAGAVFLFGSWAWFDIPRDKFPTLFCLCIGSQLLGLVGLLVCGFRTI